MANEQINFKFQILPAGRQVSNFLITTFTKKLRAVVQVKELIYHILLQQNVIGEKFKPTRFVVRFAKGKGVVLVILSVLTINIFSLFGETQNFASLQVEKHLNDPAPRLNLIDQLISLNNLDKAKQEVYVSLGYWPNSPELKNREKIVNGITQRPVVLENQLNYWRFVLLEKPNYRDAYLKASAISWQLYKDKEAKVYLEKAIELDPNYEKSKSLENIIFH